MLAGIIVLQVLVAVLSIDLLSAVRAYVTGESLYSKGQKDAQIHLLDYADTQQDEHYQRFLVALAVPLGDRKAREALQQEPPDVERARQGFIEGGNHPDDIDGLIRLFRWFHRVPFMADPIATWTEGDRVIEQMRALVDRARERLQANEPDAPAVREMLTQAPILNKRLTELESDFSAQLGAASRQAKGLLLGLNLALALLLALIGVAFVRQNLRTHAAAEGELRRREQSLQLLLNSTAEGLYGVDTDGNCTFVNRSALAMLGYGHESDLVGRNIHRLIHHTHADGRPYPGQDCRMYQAYRLVEAVHVTDEVFWTREGASFPVEYWSHPVVQDGKVRGAVATFFDIGERLRTQAALRESEKRLSRLVDSVADGVITVDAEENVVLFNRAAERLFHTPASEAVGQPLERFIPERQRPAHHDMLRQFSRGKAETRILVGVHELTGLRAGGEEFPMEASLSRLQTDQGLLITVVLRDTSEQRAIREARQARETLEASNRAKTDFLSRMSHELRTPLNAVLGFAQLLRMDREHAMSVDQLQRVQHIEHAGAHLLALVNDVLDLSQVEAGRLTLSLEAVDMQVVADEAVAIVSPLAVSAEVVIIQTPLPSSPASWVVADRVRLRQVLVNLLSNAVKYNRTGGRVTLSLNAHEGLGEFVIADTGGGMTPEQLARLFEPFNRLGAERSGVEGTGIGLVLSQHLVDMMRGSLEIDSAVGRGTVATVQLQRASRPTVHAPAPFMPSQHGGLDGKLHVLYAEDNEVNVELVRQAMVFRPAVSLRAATSGAMALQMARAEAPDLLLVDMHLGDMTGLELADMLRRDPAMAHIHLVALSADALPDQIKAAIDRGFEAYLTKPIDFRELLRVLDGYMNG
ncbi:MAG: PAS domain S-box protein [Vitreoscilla sp.]|nr:PAS domain S-box protein [Vitreoscilla sp.]